MKKGAGIRERLRERRAARQVVTESEKAVDEEGWELLNKRDIGRAFHFKLKLPREVYAKFNTTPLSLLQLFQRFVPPKLLRDVLDRVDPNSWVINASRGDRVDPKLKYIYRVLAAQIFIIGQYGLVKNEEPETRDIRKSMFAARDYFHAHGQEGFPGENIWTRINAVFHLSQENFGSISENFQSIIESLGQAVAGDEKLFHFTGDTPFLRHVPSKPDQVGLWNYELCV